MWWFLQNVDSEPKVDKPATAHVMEDSCSDADLQLNKNCERQMSKQDTGVLEVNTEENCHNTARGNNTLLQDNVYIHMTFREVL